MATRIIINGKEITNPVIKTLLMLGAVIVAAVVTAIVIFVLLPVIGVAITLSAGFILIFIISTIVSLTIMTFVTLIAAWLLGAEFRIERIYRRKQL